MIPDISIHNKILVKGGRGHWAVNYTGTQSFISMIIYIDWFITISVQTF